jgi:hypothetical protein
MNVIELFNLLQLSTQIASNPEGPQDRVVAEDAQVDQGDAS